MTDDPELAEFEERRSANRKTLAIIGLILVGGLLLWKCATQVDRIGLGVGSGPVTVKSELDLTVERSGRIVARGCNDDLESCLARWKIREGANYKVAIFVEPGAPQQAVTSVRELVQSYELVPIVQ